MIFVEKDYFSPTNSTESLLERSCLATPIPVLGIMNA